MPLVAQARGYTLPDTDVTITVQPDGSISVTEEITYRFDGSFSGAYREIPLRAGESIRDIEVSDAQYGNYAPGACTDLGCSSPQGTYGAADLGGRVRIVWHYAAQDTDRTFVVSYVVDGATIAYDDIVDLNWKVWGDEWTVRLDDLRANVFIPSGAQADDVRVWGHPSSVAGTTSLGDDRISPTLRARDIPAGQWVEMRVTFPRSLLTSTAGAQVREGDGLGNVLDEEARQFEQDESEAARRRTLILTGLFGGTIPGLVAGWLFYRRFGKEPDITYDREYEQEPPSDLSPAEVSALISQGNVSERDFVATLFDLIRRGHLDARPVTYDESTWMGMKTETITDLELSLGTATDELADHEEEVMEIMARILDDGPSTINDLRDRIREDASANASSYGSFRSDAALGLTRKKLLDTTGRRQMGWIIAPGALLLFLSIMVASTIGSGSAFGILLVVLIGGNLLLFALAVGRRRAYVKRTDAGALESARWEAFSRYLSDFSRLEEAPAMSLALWDRFLVYALSFGIAEEVLEAARLRAPAELQEASRIYWYGNNGFTGGSTQNAFSGLQSSLRGAFAPPSSAGTGGGGGFGGGGGGGAW